LYLAEKAKKGNSDISTSQEKKFITANVSSPVSRHELGRITHQYAETNHHITNKTIISQQAQTLPKKNVTPQKTQHNSRNITSLPLGMTRISPRGIRISPRGISPLMSCQIESERT